MTELNQNLYKASCEALKEAGLPEHLVDAASRIVATDEAGKPDLGRNEIDTEICKQVVERINSNERD
ncbi:MAG: hypothetical protein KME29_15745 [Calothrix sp. FI2-JRJ7]|jgi:hypothetical protein|nr:hypothetical protein [Calothrix sp. FI2-JRJ7]